jgi:hypothetical protein
MNASPARMMSLTSDRFMTFPPGPLPRVG